jgi:hypothetical protein
MTTYDLQGIANTLVQAPDDLSHRRGWRDD